MLNPETWIVVYTLFLKSSNIYPAINQTFCLLDVKCIRWEIHWIHVLWHNDQPGICYCRSSSYLHPQSRAKNHLSPGMSMCLPYKLWHGYDAAPKTIKNVIVNDGLHLLLASVLRTQSFNRNGFFSPYSVRLNAKAKSFLVRGHPSKIFPPAVDQTFGHHCLLSP